MSFTRRGTDSDVYVYLSNDGYCCNLCPLQPGCPTIYLQTPEEMIEHLKEHKKEGHLVPDYAFKELKEEQIRMSQTNKVNGSNVDGQEITQEELDKLPELQEKVVLFQPSETESSFVIDSEKTVWAIGYYKGTKYKQRTIQ